MVSFTFSKRIVLNYSISKTGLFQKFPVTLSWKFEAW